MTVSGRGRARKPGGLWRVWHERRHGAVILRSEQIDAAPGQRFLPITLRWLSCSCGRTKRVRS